MNTLDIALCQLPVTETDPAANRARVLAAIEAHGRTHDLLVFPETCLSGFSRREEVLAAAEPLNGPVLQQVAAACARLDTSVALGVAELDAGTLYNTAVLVAPQGIVGSYRKTQLWAADRAIFQPGDALRVFAWNGLRVGLLICFDIEFPETARALAALGADLLVIVNSNMDPFGAVHVRAAGARAQENQVFLAMANRVGVGRDDVFAGQSMVIAPSGETLLQLERHEAIGSCRIDLTQIAASRSAYTYLQERREPALDAVQTLAGGTLQVRVAPALRDRVPGAPGARR